MAVIQTKCVACLEIVCGKSKEYAGSLIAGELGSKVAMVVVFAGYLTMLPIWLYQYKKSEEGLHSRRETFHE